MVLSEILALRSSSGWSCEGCVGTVPAVVMRHLEGLVRVAGDACQERNASRRNVPMCFAMRTYGRSSEQACLGFVGRSGLSVPKDLTASLLCARMCEI